jgi:hypothetical protein
MSDYGKEVAAYTHGKGRFVCRTEGYFPCHNAEAVIAEMGYIPEADMDNTPDSVFCAKGAGFVVPWTLVTEYMHLEAVASKSADDEPLIVEPKVNEKNVKIDEKELEAISRGDYTMNSPLGAKGNAAVYGGVLESMRKKGIPPVTTTDGPSGIRLTSCATLMPIGTEIACTWNTDLAYDMGVAGGLECKENGLATWLTPALNIHRNPLCGRNFEYFSEDPFISGKFAAAQVQGIQSTHTAASPKHFVANNKETNRYYSDSRVSERALREIYLRGFEICVKEAQPWTVMTSYNIVNGRRTCECFELIEGILRQEWGFDGMVITDWHGPCNQEHCIIAGNDVRMPSGIPDAVREALRHQRIRRCHLVVCVKHILEMILKLD